MKIEKVVISAFRIYDDPKDGTFDFMLETGTPANFVSIYAPNGFGKTSFYDAVEWGITNHVSRFEIRGKENEKLNKSQNSQVKRPVIRNNGADSQLKTSVHINTTLDNYERVWKRHAKNQYDIDFTNPDKVENRDFQSVILSQEWISSFLTEVKGDERFSKFTKLPELNEVSTYYKNILGLKGELESRKSGHKTKIAQLESDLTEFTDPKLLQRTNEQIAKINKEFNHSLAPIRIETNDQELLELKNQMISLKPTVAKLKQLEEELEYIAKAINGGSDLYSLKQYFKNKERGTQIKKELETLENILGQFDTLSQKETALSSVLKQVGDVKAELKEANEIESQFEKYFVSVESIAAKEKEIEVLNDKEKGLKTDISKVKREVLNQNAELESLIKKIAEEEDTSRKIPELDNKLNEAIELKAKISDNNTRIQNAIKLENINLNQSAEKLSEINASVKGLKQGKIPPSPPLEVPGLSSELEKIRSNFEELEAKDTSSQILKVEIQKQEELNSSLEEFIRQGLEIANETQTSNCPLCEHDYGSFQELAKKIAGNKALSKRLQELLLSQANLEKERSALLKTIEKDTATVINEFDSLVYTVKQEEKNLLKKIDTLKQEEKDKDAELKRIDKEIVETKAVFKGQDAGNFKKLLQDELDDLLVKREEKTQDLDKTKAELSHLEKELEIAQSQIKLLNQEIESQKKDTIYTKVQAWIEKKLVGLDDEKKEISMFLNELDLKIKTLIEQEDRLKQDIENLNKSLQSYSSESTKTKVEELRIEIESIQKNLGTYSFHLKNIQVNTEDLSQNELKKRLNAKNDDLRSQYEQLYLLQKELELLSGYIENIEGFLRSERIKSRIKDEKKELTFLNKEIGPKLKREKDKVVHFLENRIQGFFQIELINQIYNKIDPHPEYKKVNFVPNFDTDEPRLDVFVTDGDGQEKLIPNLYFSTAQINVLSLCIFLATALTSKDYNCIFIDDPVQSMDSINVLSTIDLLRSLCTQYDKQIILSTHDENFHRLLKKKIPSGLFKSKFLELEAFGKVKTSKDTGSLGKQKARA